jgi:hypothetical protein
MSTLLRVGRIRPVTATVVALPRVTGVGGRPVAGPGTGATTESRTTPQSVTVTVAARSGHGRRRAEPPRKRRRRGSGLRLALANLVGIVLVMVLTVYGAVSLREPPLDGSATTSTQDTAADAVPADPNCHKAPLPPGYAVADGVPYREGGLTGKAYNPQTITIIVNATLADSRSSVPDRVCLARWLTQSLLSGSRRIGFTAADGKPLFALTFPYPFEFSANPSLPALRPGWLSGLAQGSVLGVLTSMFDLTQDKRYLDQAREVFNSFLLPADQGGFVTTAGGLTYLQEYPTSVPSYVLNGHNEALGAVLMWARRTGDPRAVDLAQRATTALHTTTALEEVPFPTGLASSYDLLRGYPAAPLRVASTGWLTLTSAALVDAAGHPVGPLVLPVAAPADPGPNLLVNGTFTDWTGTTPQGWRPSLTQSGTIGHGQDGGVALTSTGPGEVELLQEVPASSVQAGRPYTASWQAAVHSREGTASSSGRVVLRARCGATVTELAAADVRGTGQVTESITGTPNAGCALQVLLAKADPVDRPVTIEYRDVAVRLSEPVGAAVPPSYPMSVLQVPRLFARVTFTGSGTLQGYTGGRWITVGSLDGGRGSATVEIPAFLQGRNVNLRYHDSHVRELAVLFTLTGDPALRERALSWLRYAPSAEDVRPSLAG